MDGETEPMGWTGYKLPEGATEVMIVIIEDGAILARYMLAGILCQSLVRDGNSTVPSDLAYHVDEPSLLSIPRANLSDFLKGIS